MNGPDVDVFSWTQRHWENHPGSRFTISPMCTKMLANFQSTGNIPFPGVIHFSMLLGDRLLLPVKTACAPVAETRARLWIPYVPWSRGLRGEYAGKVVYNELHNCTVKLVSTGWASQELEILVSLWPVFWTLYMPNNLSFLLTWINKCLALYD